MASDDVLRLVIWSWLVISTVITFSVEQHTARRLERPMKRSIIVTSVIGFTLLPLAVVIYMLGMLGIIDW